MTNSVSEEKKKPLLKLFNTVAAAELEMGRYEKKFYKFLKKAEAKTQGKELDAAVEAKLEAKFNKFGMRVEAVEKENEAAVTKAAEKAKAKGLTDEDVLLAKNLIDSPAQFKEIFGADALDKDLRKDMKKFDKSLVKFGEQPRYAGFYAK